METGRVFDAIVREMRSASGSWLNRCTSARRGMEEDTRGEDNDWKGKSQERRRKKEAREKWRGRVSRFNISRYFSPLSLSLLLATRRFFSKAYGRNAGDNWSVSMLHPEIPVIER